MCCDSENRRAPGAPGARSSRILDSRRREIRETTRLREGHRAAGRHKPHYITSRSPSPIFSSFSYFCIFLLITRGGTHAQSRTVFHHCALVARFGTSDAQRRQPRDLSRQACQHRVGRVFARAAPAALIARAGDSGAIRKRKSLPSFILGPIWKFSRWGDTPVRRNLSYVVSRCRARRNYDSISMVFHISRFIWKFQSCI